MEQTAIADTVQIKRMTEFASDVLRLADERPDLELRLLIDGLYSDLIVLKGDSDG